MLEMCLLFWLILVTSLKQKPWGSNQETCKAWTNSQLFNTEVPKPQGPLYYFILSLSPPPPHQHNKPNRVMPTLVFL